MMGITLDVANRLAVVQKRIVFAESCTCGMVACELGKVPGVSRWLCGSAVTYRDETKIGWLDIERADMAAHSAVSESVAHQMAMGVLTKTPEADLALSITGHFGPEAPDGLDGVIFVGVAKRKERGMIDVHVDRFELTTKDRLSRQRESTERVLTMVLECL